MKHEHLLEDVDLDAAFRSVRDAYDGTNAESNATLQRALFRTRKQERRQRLTRWVVVPIAAVLVASTAWAGVTGKLVPAVQSVLEAVHPEQPAPHLDARPTPVETPAATAEAQPAEVTPVPVMPVPMPVPDRAAPQVEIKRPLAATPKPAEPPPAPAPTASTPDPYAALFAEAHRVHFIERDPARALAAWDRYLVAAPNGRFSPEARYNRALRLVRLGRSAEAKTELEAFASGTYGSYRRDEAKALLDAL